MLTRPRTETVPRPASCAGRISELGTRATLRWRDIESHDTWQPTRSRSRWPHARRAGGWLPSVEAATAPRSTLTWAGHDSARSLDPVGSAGHLRWQRPTAPHSPEPWSSCRRIGSQRWSSVPMSAACPRTCCPRRRRVVRRRELVELATEEPSARQTDGLAAGFHW